MQLRSASVRLRIPSKISAQAIWRGLFYRSVCRAPGRGQGIPTTPQTVRLCSGIRRREKPPEAESGGSGKEWLCGLSFNRVVALPVLGLRGRDSEPELLPHSPRQESSNAVRLPAGSFHQLRQGSSLGPLQHFQNLGGLAAIAATGSVLGRIGRFLSGLGLLSGDTLEFSSLSPPKIPLPLMCCSMRSLYFSGIAPLSRKINNTSLYRRTVPHFWPL
jgi:hypothetical protein